MNTNSACRPFRYLHVGEESLVKSCEISNHDVDDTPIVEERSKFSPNLLAHCIQTNEAVARKIIARRIMVMR